MKIAIKLALAASLILTIVASNAWALPVAGTTVTMENDWTVPYTMTDANGDVYSSFCLEKENYFSPGSVYFVDSVGDYAVGGGEGADEYGRDEVSEDTKWLYAAYMSHVFDELDGAAGMVQSAIWFLEGEDSSSEASGAWSTLSQYTFDDSNWVVVAVNLTSKSYSSIVDNQSQLVGATAPVPEPATMLLLGTGLLGLAGIKHRKKLQA